jgi:hypothetical protein
VSTAAVTAGNRSAPAASRSVTRPSPPAATRTCLPTRSLSRTSSDTDAYSPAWGIAFELLFAAALVYLAPLQALFGTAPLGPVELAILAVFPVVVWGSDELRKQFVRSRARGNY